MLWTGTLVSFYRYLSMGNPWKTGAEITETKCQVALYKKISILLGGGFSCSLQTACSLLIGIKTMMTIIPEKSAYCCRWARKLGESFYVVNCMGCFRNIASNFIRLADRSSTSVQPVLSLRVLYPPRLCCGGGGEVLLVCFRSRLMQGF